MAIQMLLKLGKSLNKPSRDAKQNSLNIRHPVNLRSDAAWVLFQILDNGRSSREVMPIVWARHANPKDRAWLQQMVFGCLRNLPKLQIWLRALLNKPLKKQQKIIEHLLMVGLYQLAFARTADHAAVSETVGACKQMKEIGLSGLVNAVMRNFQREDLANQAIEEKHAQLGLPKWIYRILQAHYPEQIDTIAHNMQERAAIWIRVNLLAVEFNEYQIHLQKAGYEYTAIAPNTIQLNKPGEITLLPGYEQGWFAVQDYAAQQAAFLLAPQANDIILDCCAAPGGKTAGILELQEKIGHLYVLDSEQKRVERIHENMARLGHDARFQNKLSIVTQDARDLSSLPEFDRILLDAPCSATGVIRRHPDIMWLRKRGDIDVLVNLQREILEQAWLKLKPGGTLVYATCSILPQENQQQIDAFLAAHSNAKLSPIEREGKQALPYWQILPGEENMDGFFYARLIKC